MQKCAVLPGKMQKSGAKLGKTNVHVEVERSTKIVMVEINKVRVFGFFSMLENFEKMKLDTNLDTNCRNFLYLICI